MRDRLLTKLATWLVKNPWWSLLIISTITVVFAWFASMLEYRLNITDMMPEDDPMIQEYLMIMDEYDGANNIIIVAEGDPDKLDAFAEDVAPQVTDLEEYIKNVVHNIPLEFYTTHGLMLSKSSDLKNSRELFENPNLVGFLNNLNNSFEKEYIQSDDQISNQEQEQGAVRFLDGIQSWVAEFDGVLDGDLVNTGQAATDAILVGDHYFRSWDRQMLIIQAFTNFDIMDIDLDIAVTDTVEKIVKLAGEKHGVQAGITGGIPVQRDEMRAIEESSSTLFALALLGILVLFIIAFRMIISPLFAMITLVMGITWALGLAWLVSGELSLFTSMMGVILIGLGVDFAIHIISVYTEMRAQGKDLLESMIQTMKKSGGGIITGGITTALAFMTLMVAEMDGMKEFGIMLGLGILMTMVATLIALPTMLTLRERTNIRFRKLLKRNQADAKVKPARDISFWFLGDLAQWLSRKWAVASFVVLIVVLAFGYIGSGLEYDYDMLNMEPVGLESIELQKRLLDYMDMDIMSTLITASSLEEAREITDKLKKTTTAGRIESISDFLPPEEEQSARAALVTDIRSVMENARISPRFTSDDYGRLREEIDRLEANMLEIQTMAIIGGQDKVYLKSALLVGTVPEEDDPSLLALHDKLDPIMTDISRGVLTDLQVKLDEQGEAALGYIIEFHRDFSQAYRATVMSMANSEPISMESLPDMLKKQYVGKSGDNYLIFVYPKQNAWEYNFMIKFQEEMYEISPRTTGMITMTFIFLDTMKKDGSLAIILAIIAIFLLLLLDFRSFRKAGLAIIPLIGGIILMVGTMQIAGMMLNMMNLIIIPLIIGIGVDDGVHIVHRYRVEGDDAHKIVFASTGRAVFLTSVTTMIGFGVLWFHLHRGMASMGSSLFIGVGTCFIATVFIIPVLAGMGKQFRKNNK